MKNICIFGTGFIGLPLALSFAMRGCTTIGVDIDVNLVNELNKGITDHCEQYQELSIQQILQNELNKRTFSAAADGLTAMQICDNVIVTVGIPIEKGDYNLGPIVEVSHTIGRGLKKDDLVIIRSTVIPGTTQTVIKPILEQESGMKAGTDFYLAYSSERVAEGKAFYEFENMPAVLAGVNSESTEKARALLSIVTKARITVASQIEVVETAKVMENISRDVDIAMVNEFAKFCKAMGIDIREVIETANSHQRVNLLSPGPGVGGYCLPNAFYYLQPRARQLGVDLKLLASARTVNDGMPSYAADLVLKNLHVPPSEATIAVLGLAMKDYSNDDRLSPALSIVDCLIKAGCNVKVFDPVVMGSYPFQVESLEQALTGAHGIVIPVLQKGIDYSRVAQFKDLLVSEPRPFIIDLRGVYSRNSAIEHDIIIEHL